MEATSSDCVASIVYFFTQNSSLVRKRLYIILCLFLPGFIFFACEKEKAEDLNSVDSGIRLSLSEAERINAEADALHAAGVDASKKDKYLEAFNLYQQSLKKRSPLFHYIHGLSDALSEKILEGLAKSHQNIANYYFNEEGNYDRSDSILSVCLDILKNAKETEWYHKRVARALHAKGQVRDETGSLKEALTYYQDAYRHFYISEDSGLPGTLNDISKLYGTWREPDSAILYAQKAITAHLTYGADSIDLPLYYHNLGIGYMLRKQYALAKRAYDIEFALYKLGFVADPIDLTKHYHNVANLLLEQKPFQQQAALLAIGEAIKRNTAGLPDIKARLRLAHNYSVRGNIYYKAGQYGKALENQDMALRHFSIQATAWSNVNLFELQDHKIDFLEAIEGKAKTLLAMGDFHKAAQHYDIAIRYINEYKLYLSDESSKLQLSDVTKKIFEGAIRACLNPQKPDVAKAFGYAEQSKSFALLETVLQVKAMNKLTVIDTVLQNEFSRIPIKIAGLEKQIENTESIQDQITLRETIHMLRRRSTEIEQQFLEDENYKKLTSTLDYPDAGAIQTQLLESNQALVEYFVGEAYSYLFYLPAKGSMEVYPLPGREVLSGKIDSLVQIGIRLPFTDVEKIRNDDLLKLKQKQYKVLQAYCDTLYANYAHELYELLLGPLRKSAQPNPERLMIIPDDVLGYLPFDALLSSKPEEIGAYKAYNYTGVGENGYQIGYCYSAALLKEMRSHQRKANGDQLLAFCLADGESTFSTQTSDLETLFKAAWAPFYNKFKRVTSKKELKKYISQARFIHFATHGETDDRNSNYSRLLMSAKNTEDSLRYLYLYEIYDFPLHADLVVTSACETGIGRLYRGEGIISLARGFSAAGASSIVTTLWSVNAETSGDLLKHFYEGLQKKDRKDAALTHAKHQWIQDRAEDRDARPYYWAGIVPVGDMQAIELPLKDDLSKTILLICAGGLLILFSAIALYRRRRTI